jgi:hypothetical protein
MEVGRLTNRSSGRVKDKVPSSYSARAPLNSTVKPQQALRDREAMKNSCAL